MSSSLEGISIEELQLAARNHGLPLEMLREPITPVGLHYLLIHFDIPVVDPATWRLEIAGNVERPLTLTLDEIRARPARTLAVTLECAGNGRSMFRPKVEGEPWALGAVSTAAWKGTPLSGVLVNAGLEPGAKYLVFRAAEGFERGLSLDEARQAMLVFEMNGRRLPPEHGYPVRLVVPGWYAVASVKWLTEIEVTGRAFEGHFQTDRYVYEWERDGAVVREPVRLQQVRSIITEPTGDVALPAGDLVVRGVAWSGAASIARVDVRVGDGPWQPARLIGERQRGRWQWWELITRAEEPGEVVVRARATDLAERTQPETPLWNRLGYGGNAVQAVRVRLT